MSDVAAVELAVADAHRREWARVLASTMRVARDLDLAEECVQEAYAAALKVWVRDGIPGNRPLGLPAPPSGGRSMRSDTSGRCTQGCHCSWSPTMPPERTVPLVPIQPQRRWIKQQTTS